MAERTGRTCTRMGGRTRHSTYSAERVRHNLQRTRFSSAVYILVVRLMPLLGAGPFVETTAGRTLKTDHPATVVANHVYRVVEPFTAREAVCHPSSRRIGLADSSVGFMSVSQPTTVSVGKRLQAFDTFDTALRWAVPRLRSKHLRVACN